MLYLPELMLIEENKKKKRKKRRKRQQRGRRAKESRSASVTLVRHKIYLRKRRSPGQAATSARNAHLVALSHIRRRFSYGRTTSQVPVSARVQLRIACPISSPIHCGECARSKWPLQTDFVAFSSLEWWWVEFGIDRDKKNARFRKTPRDGTVLNLSQKDAALFALFILQILNLSSRAC